MITALPSINLIKTFISEILTEFETFIFPYHLQSIEYLSAVREWESDIYKDVITKHILEYLYNVVKPYKKEVYNAGMEILNSSKIDGLLSEQEKLNFRYNLVFHDFSKISVNEVFGYANYDRKAGTGKAEFELAWHHHKMNNPHHPEYWLNPNCRGELEPLPMPKIYILEMIADWIGAGKTYGSTLVEWLPSNIGKFQFANPLEVSQLIERFTGIETHLEANNRLSYIAHHPL